MLMNPKLKNSLAYHQLVTALNNQEVSHAYLLIGRSNQEIKEIASFLAQSLLCEKDEIACESCGSCERVQEENHPDYRHLNGGVKAITKKEVDELQSYFSKSAVENKKGRKVCFLEHMETASSAAQNSLLKFLEEPSAGVTILLSAPSEFSILSTLVSRCISIRVGENTASSLRQEALEVGFNEEEAYFLSIISEDMEELKRNQEKEVYGSAVYMLQESLENPKELLVDYHISYKPEEKENQLLLLEFFFKLVAQAMRQSLKKEEIGPDWLKNYIRKAKDDAYLANIYALMMDALDRLNKYNDPSLLLEQTIYLWRNCK